MNLLSYLFSFLIAQKEMLIAGFFVIRMVITDDEDTEDNETGE